MERIIATVTLLIAFVVMASIFVPDRSIAGPASDPSHASPSSHGAEPAPAHATPSHAEPAPAEFVVPSTDAHEGLLSIGSLDGECFRVEIWATKRGPRYSVYDVESGELLGTLLTPEQVVQQFPELPLPDLDFSAPTTIMMAEPERWPG